MPTLNWIGKDKVVSHHLEVPYRVLDRKYTFGDTPDSGNMIIHGDNLEALKALLPQYEGKIKCIYIDPPYNTGNENWVYNDNVNDPHIRKWLGKIVGAELDDLSRHDKWLCMMYPRLTLLQKLLSDDGAIFISIDENEIATLRLISDEIFGRANFVGQWQWFKSATPPNLSHKIKRNVEYILGYEKHKNSFKYKGTQKISKSDDPLIKPQNTIKCLEFPIGSINFKLKNGTIKAGIYGTAQYPNTLLNDVIIKDGINTNEAVFENRFIWTQSKLYEELEKQTKINCSKDLVLSYKKSNYDPEVPPNLIDESVGVDTTEEAGKLLTRIFGKKDVFEFPKSPSLIQYIINFLCEKDSIILDSFAGSGTTAHAVLNLNKQDGGHRKFILCEMCDYAENITAERVRRVMKGYGASTGSAPAVEGTGGSFDFYELGETIFDPATGNLNDNADTEQIRRYLWFSETNSPYPATDVDAMNRVSTHPYFLGTHQHNNYYFYYIKGKETCLDWDFLNTFTEQDRAEMYIIYADRCVLTEEEMLKLNIRFKKIPRDIKRV
ncbi:MAG: site-specific DNA-methyltransferase [Bacteroidales bacterium]|nr:site-specific DNA-methyltransferase [Bacteroidales bacterium]